MKKILHIIHTPARGGGLSNFVMNYYRKIDREKLQFDFIYFREAEDSFEDEITELGGRMYKFISPMPGNGYKREAEEFFSAHRGEYDAVHCHALFAAAVYGPIAKKYGIKNIIQHSHSIGYGKGMLRKVRNFMLIRRGVKNATCYMACSVGAAKFMFGEKRTRSGEVKIIPNAVDAAKYRYNSAIRNDVRRELGIAEDALVLCHAGGFTIQKNHRFIIEVFRRIYAANRNSYLLLAGGAGTVAGSTYESIRELVKEYGLSDNVRFLGVRRDVNRIFIASDEFIFPSVFEGFGIVLVEAQAAGLLCFASDAVPRDAGCTELVSYMPLKLGAEVWSERLLLPETINENRGQYADKIRKYDINIQKKVLEDAYLSME